jgi:hypothetical protein
MASLYGTSFLCIKLSLQKKEFFKPLVGAIVSNFAEGLVQIKELKVFLARAPDEKGIFSLNRFLATLGSHNFESQHPSIWLYCILLLSAPLYLLTLINDFGRLLY